MQTTARRIEDMRPPTHREWVQLGRDVDRNLIETLRGLSPEDWDALTDCAPWTVKDVVAHILAWAEASLSPKEMTHQFRGGWKTRKQHGGTLHAQNDFQITDRRAASPEELIERFERLQPRFHALRNGLGGAGKVIPFKEMFTGTWVTLGFTVDTIFARDHFMHLLDIHRAIQRPPKIGPSEMRVAHDAIREWANKADADVTLTLTEPAGGTFTRGSGDRAHITCATLDLCRVLAGRRVDDIHIEGDQDAARNWLTVKAVF